MTDGFGTDWLQRQLELLDDLPPVSWGEHEQPTPEVWLAWFESGTPEQRLAIAELALVRTEQGSRCFLEDHPGQLAHLRRQVSVLEEELSQETAERRSLQRRSSGD